MNIVILNSLTWLISLRISDHIIIIIMKMYIVQKYTEKMKNEK